MEKMYKIDCLSQVIEHDKEEFDNVVLIPRNKVINSSHQKLYKHTLMKHTTSLYSRY